MEKKDNDRVDNPAAFPYLHEDNGNPTVFEPGMTLRDYFAAKAMQGMLANEGAFIDNDVMAHDCYEMADAMLSARQK